MNSSLESDDAAACEGTHGHVAVAGSQKPRNFHVFGEPSLRLVCLLAVEPNSHPGRLACPAAVTPTAE
ncbi:hypothetical protein CO652_29275 [Rhizobium sp. H4]|nr:hypothetical protein CO652_29275 [Rhizobium sp. H4]